MQCLVIGAGYVGLATAAALRARGHLVWVRDTNEQRVAEHNRAIYGVNKRDPLGEPGMRDALHGVIITTAPLPPDAVPTDAVFVCVGTPADGDTIDCEPLYQIVYDAFTDREMIVVVRSTVTPQFVRSLLDRLSLSSKMPNMDPRVAIVPEFMREGHAVEDALNPSRVVVGASGNSIAERVHDLLADPAVPLYPVTPEEASLIKLAANGFLAARAWYARAVATACEKITNGDSRRVLAAIGADPRIPMGTPGLAVGGPCLPKDTLALHTAYPDAFWPMLTVWEEMRTVSWVMEAVTEITSTDEQIMVLGAGFKLDSSDWRDSPVLRFVVPLLSVGYDVTVADPRLTFDERAALHAEVYGDAQRLTPSGRDVPRGTFAVVDRPQRHVEYGVVVLCGAPIGFDEVDMAPDAIIVDPYGLVEHPHSFPPKYVVRGRGPRRG